MREIIHIDSVVDVILNTSFFNVDEIVRFNGTPMHKKETVSQHSYWVTLFAHLLCGQMFKSGTRKVLEFAFEATRYALFHDFDEIITGDVIYPLKHNAENGKSIKSLMSDFVDKELGRIKGEIGDTLLSCIGKEGVNERVELLIKICDWLSCLKYLRQEWKMGNNNVYHIINVSVREIGKVIDTFIPEMEKEFIDEFNKDIFLQLKTEVQNVALH